MNIVVGFAPLERAEFVVIKIPQMVGQIEAWGVKVRHGCTATLRPVTSTRT